MDDHFHHPISRDAAETHISWKIVDWLDGRTARRPTQQLGVAVSVDWGRMVELAFLPFVYLGQSFVPTYICSVGRAWIE